MLSEMEIIEYEVTSCTFVQSYIYRYFHNYFMWKCKRKFKRYLGHMEYRRLEGIRKDKLRQMLTKTY